jgi:wyosine [tRNA(Phe)-imidazoG37] synthetase (radical SAM superfamily)
VSGDFFDRFEVPETLRRVSDIAISGNGEPTSAAAFPKVVDTIGEAAAASGLLGGTNLVLITNGSLTRRKNVQEGLARWSQLGGEAWFKLDSATREGLLAINGICRSPAGVALDLAACAATCPTWIQTCLFALDESVPSNGEQRAYLDFLRERLRESVALRGVLLYGLARPSLQPGADRLSRLPEDWMEEFAARIRELGLTVRVHP